VQKGAKGDFRAVQVARVADHYRTLGVAPDSDRAVIRAAFKALMLKVHPDTSNSPDATRRAMEINAAWSVLRDPRSRSVYDRAYRASHAAGVAAGTAWHRIVLVGSRPTPQRATRRRSHAMGGWLTAGLALAILPIAVANGDDREQPFATGNVTVTTTDWPGAF